MRWMKLKKVKAIGNIIGFNIDASGNETYNVQFPDMTVAELESYQFEDADAYHTNGKPRCLRNVLARLRELPEHDKQFWMDEIMHEFANDYGSVKYTLGYEQGKFDGVVEAEKSNKVVIPQFVADWIEEGKKTCRDVQDLFIFDFNSEEVKRWFLDYKPFDLVARAWLDGYEVEQKKRYRIKMKNEEYNHTVVIGDYTCEEIEATGFGWVFDCEDVEVQEVE